MPLYSTSDRTYQEWRDLMLAGHDGHVDVSRARFNALTSPWTVAECEREQARSFAAIASIRADIRHHEELLRVALRDNLLTPPSSISPGGEPWAPIYARYIEERAELLRRHEQRIASYRKQIDAIEAVDARKAMMAAPMRAAE